MPGAPFSSLRTVLRLNQGSLRWRISWLLALMAIVIVTAFGSFAYRTARVTTLTATHTRLRSAVAQINTIAELGVVNQLDTLRSVAKDPAVVSALRSPAGPLGEAALVPLHRLQGSGANASLVELDGLDGRVLYRSDASLAQASNRPAMSFPVEGAIGPIYDGAGTQMFDVGVGITDGDTRLGTLQVTRRLGRGANRRIIAGLLGDQAALLIGNQGGPMWGETGSQRYPAGAGPVSYERDGQTWVSVSASVRGTPWLYAVEVPEYAAIAPARALLTPFLVTGFVLALAAALVGLLIGRRITSPLADLTKAAEAMARGDRTVTLAPARRNDEIGRLSHAFGTMASSVHAVQDRLESEADASAGELRRAVGRLRQLDDELRRNERFATLGRLSGSVGHELRNPLGVMSTVVFLLDALPDASPKLKDYSALLREQIRLSERIISDVLDRARANAPVYTPVNLARLLEDLLIRAELPSTITVEMHVAPALPPMLLDRDRVGQVIWNLVTNAVQAMQGAGTLTIRASIAGGRLRIEVSDSGPGISASDAERVFEPLFTTKNDGVGLGLSISQAFARSNGGDLFVKTGHVGGACFVFELPIRPAADVAAAGSVSASPARTASAQ